MTSLMWNSQTDETEVSARDGGEEGIGKLLFNEYRDTVLQHEKRPGDGQCDVCTM